MLSNREQRIVDDVVRYGWHCTKVLPGEIEENEPAFAYTVGLWETIRAPELIVFGLDLDLMHAMLDCLVSQLRAGAELADGARWSGLLEGFECVSRPVHPTRLAEAHMNGALWYHAYRGGDCQLSTFQIFWPTALQGLFPWEAGSDPVVRQYQPLLYLPAESGMG